jgi:hypothetical protein
MRHLRNVCLAAAAALGLAFAGGQPAVAASGIKIGSLTCDVAGGIGMILGSSKKVACQFNGPHGVEFYSGVINKFGLDIGVTGHQVMSWVVFAPGKVGPGSLSGTYVGATAEATAAIGAGANVLIGGFNKSLTLQPVSVSAQTGLNVAAGVAELVLHSR